MRILPHCIRHIRDDKFDALAKDILTDGVTTHGHPRALVGALAYGYACWLAFRVSGTLEYGELVARTIKGANEWGVLPDIADRWEDWFSETSNRILDYEKYWGLAVDEMQQLLNIARDGIRSGSIGSDDKVLEELGAFSKATKGAGTVSGAAALYFASRYAATPMDGLLSAASAVGIDTDTIASMSGALLGAIDGLHWLSRLKERVQDRNYLSDLATRLIRDMPLLGDAVPERVRKSSLQRFLKQIELSSSANPLFLLNGQAIRSVEPYRSAGMSDAGGQGPRYWLVISEAGQHFFVRGNRVRPGISGQQTAAGEIVESGEFDVEDGKARFFVTSVGVSLDVSNIVRSRYFYESLLGLQATAATTTAVRFQQVLALRQATESSLFPSGSVRVFLNVSNIDACKEKLVLNSVQIKEILERGPAKSFECVDPDGHVVQIFART